MEEAQENKFEALGPCNLPAIGSPSAFQPTSSLPASSASPLSVFSSGPNPLYSLFQQYLWKQCSSDANGRKQDSPIAPTSVEDSEASSSLEPQMPKVACVRVIYEAGKSKRGRKPLRPQDPIKRKTEEKDKYWLRAFRAYMQGRFHQEKKSMNSVDRFFWREYLSPEGKPDKGNKYLSYGQKYKDFLFSHTTFITHFHEWFLQYGQVTLESKYPPSSDLYFVYYDYALKELLGHPCPSAV